MSSIWLRHTIVLSVWCMKGEDGWVSLHEKIEDFTEAALETAR